MLKLIFESCECETSFCEMIVHTLAMTVDGLELEGISRGAQGNTAVHQLLG